MYERAFVSEKARKKTRETEERTRYVSAAAEPTFKIAFSSSFDFFPKLWDVFLHQTNEQCMCKTITHNLRVHSLGTFLLTQATRN